MSNSLQPHGLQPGGSSVRGILQARTLNWGTIPSSRGFSWPRGQTRISNASCLCRQALVEVLLLLLSHFSRVPLCATPQRAAHQAPRFLGLSKQEHWSGLPFPSPMQESESEVAQSCPTHLDLMDGSLPGSSIHGIFQARVLEWGAIAFSIR